MFVCISRTVCLSIIVILSILGLISSTDADVIMMNGEGAPSIIENEDIEPDVILFPGVSSLIMNDDLVL